jgi:hypothetical protein
MEDGASSRSLERLREPPDGAPRFAEDMLGRRGELFLLDDGKN